MRFHDGVRNLIDSKNKLKLLAYLFSVPAVEMSERELARVLGISNFSVNELMKLFEKHNIVQKSRLGRSTVWRLKRDGYYSEVLGKILDCITSSSSPLEHLKGLVISTYPLEKISKIYLYGSVAEGRESYNSDIDLFVVVKSRADLKEVERASDMLRNSCLVLYGNSVQVLIMDEMEYKRKKSSVLIKNVENGLKLYPKEE